MDKYTQDETGQWWCRTPKQRLRVIERICAQCKKAFVSRHPQQFCSATCRSASQKGVLRVQRAPRPCAWCGAVFTPRKVSQAPICCSIRCAYNLGNTKRGSFGEKNGNWRGGKNKGHAAGYVLQYVQGRGMVLQHRLVMEQVLGRPLLRAEQVH